MTYEVLYYVILNIPAVFNAYILETTISTIFRLCTCFMVKILNTDQNALEFNFDLTNNFLMFKRNKRYSL